MSSGVTQADDDRLSGWADCRLLDKVLVTPPGLSHTVTQEGMEFYLSVSYGGMSIYWVDIKEI